MRTGDTAASKVLEELLALPDGDLRNVLGIAVEYADHKSFRERQAFHQAVA